MDDRSASPPPGSPSPGDARPRQSLERPPSARFEPPAPGPRPSPAGRPRWSGPGTAVGIALLGVVILVLLNAILSVTAGLIAVAAVAGYLIGQALRTGEGAAELSRPGDRLTVAIVLAVTMVLAGAAGAWLAAIPQGNVLGPIEYLGQTLGLAIPLQLAAAVAAAWVGARGRPGPADRGTR